MSSTLLVSYSNFRRALGLLGVALPIVLVLGTINNDGLDHIQASISVYYHTGMRDVFVGVMFAYAVFLYTYTGYELIDQVVSRLAGVCALGVALTPTDPKPELCVMVETTLRGGIHLAFAGGFFICLAFMSLFLFTRSGKEKTPQKEKRNVVYRVCGSIMVLCMLVLFGYFLLGDRVTCNIRRLSPVFWLETIALWAFGISWLVKGEMILGDKETDN